MVVIHDIVIEPAPVRTDVPLRIRVSYENDLDGVTVHVEGQGEGVAWPAQSQPALDGTRTAQFSGSVVVTGPLPAPLTLEIQLRQGERVRAQQSRQVQVSE